MYGNTGNKKSATCFATLLQNELNSDVARFTTLIKPVLQQIRLLTGLNMGGKTRNIAIRYCCPPFPYLVVVAKTLNVLQYSYNILEHITIAIVIFAI